MSPTQRQHVRRRPVRRRAAVSVSGLVLAMVAACGTDGGDTATPGTPIATDATPEPAEQASGYPVSVENCGVTTTLEEQPQRIVSLNQASTEILLSLGVADRMVGTATWTDPVLPHLDEANEQVVRLADNYPSLEAVLDQEPDFVTSSLINTLSDGGVAGRETFEQLGVPTYMSAAECEKSEAGQGDDGARDEALQMESITTEVTELAQLVGVPERGDEVNADLRRRLEAASAADVADGTSVVFWFANAEQPYVAGGYGAPAIIARELGLENVYEESEQEWPQVGWEDFAEKDPDVIVLGDLSRRSQTAETAEAKIAFLEENPVTSRMSAVQNRRYVAVAGGDMNPSLRTVDGIEKVSAGLTRLGFTE